MTIKQYIPAPRSPVETWGLSYEEERMYKYMHVGLMPVSKRSAYTLLDDITNVVIYRDCMGGLVRLVHPDYYKSKLTCNLHNLGHNYTFHGVYNIYLSNNYVDDISCYIKYTETRQYEPASADKTRQLYVIT